MLLWQLVYRETTLTSCYSNTELQPDPIEQTTLAGFLPLAEESFWNLCRTKTEIRGNEIKKPRSDSVRSNTIVYCALYARTTKLLMLKTIPDLIEKLFTQNLFQVFLNW